MGRSMHRRNCLVGATIGTLASTQALLAGCLETSDTSGDDSGSETAPGTDDTTAAENDDEMDDASTGNDTDSSPESTIDDDTGEMDTNESRSADDGQETAESDTDEPESDDDTGHETTDDGDTGELETDDPQPDDDTEQDATEDSESPDERSDVTDGITLTGFNATVAAGETAEFTVAVRTSAAEASGTLEIAADHNPGTVDSATYRTRNHEATVTLSFPTNVRPYTESFPVTITASALNSSETVELTVIGTDADGNETDAGAV